jgi:hypothetical protein
MARPLSRTLSSGAALAALWLGASGCAGVRVYSDPGLTRETGVKVYAPKPYLLVSRTGAKDQPIELTIVYLPDTTDALYIKQQGGWGSNDLGVKVANGMLTDFGTKADSRIPETLNATGALLAAAAGVYKTAQQKLTPAKGTLEGDDQDEAARALQLIAQDLIKVTTGGSPATAPQAAGAKTIADTLAGAATALGDRLTDTEAIVAPLAALLTDIDALKLDSPPTGNNRVTIYNSRIETLKDQLRLVIGKVSPRTLADGAFELYEIRQENGRTRLVRVEIGG